MSLAPGGRSGALGSWATMSFLSAVIDEEWQRTQCIPRETCVQVANELGKSTNTFFKPPCVNVFRCGGCCNEESLTCVNTSMLYVSKQVGRSEHVLPNSQLMAVLAAPACSHAQHCAKCFKTKSQFDP